MSAGLQIIGPDDAPPARGKYVIAVPGQLAPAQRFALPDGVKGGARVAVARQQLADRIGQGAQSVALVPLGPALWTRALVVDSELLEAWCDGPLARDKRCVAILPDMLLLPYAEGTLSLKVVGGILLARAGEAEVCAAPLTLALPLLEELVAIAPPKQFYVTGELSPDIRAFLDRFDAVPAPELAAPVKPVVDMRRALEGNKTAETGIWLAAATVAFLAFGLWTSSLWIETRGLRADAASLRAETMGLLREGLIPAGPIVDIRQQVMRAMAGQANGDLRKASAVDLLSRATVALFGTGLDVGRMRYEQSSGALLIDVTAQRFAEVDALVATLNVGDLIASATDMRDATEGGIVATLRLQFVGNAG